MLLSKNIGKYKPLDFPKSSTRKLNHSLTAIRSQLSFPIISPEDQWGTWTVLFTAGAFGIWSEKTKVGAAVSGALVSVLVGLAASNLGIIACEAPAYKIVTGFLLPLAVPLLLFRADMRRVLTSTGTLLLAFLLGSVATTIGTVVAFWMVPMRSLGQDGWKIAAALMGRHIGGAVNYVAISDALQTSPSVVAAGLAADNLICAVYFTTLFALASKIPAEATQPATGHKVWQQMDKVDSSYASKVRLSILINKGFPITKRCMVIPCQGKIYMIKSANLRGHLKGFRVLNNEKSSLEITHLLHADDSLIFCDAEVEQEMKPLSKMIDCSGEKQ